MILLNEKNKIFIGSVYKDKAGNEWSVTSTFEQYVNLRNMNKDLIWFEHRFRKVTREELESEQYELTDLMDDNHIPIRVGDKIILEDDVPGFPALTKGKTIYIHDYISCGDMPLYVYELDKFGNILSPSYNLPLNAIQEIVDHPAMRYEYYPMYFNEEINKWDYNDAPIIDDSYYLD